MFLAGDTTEGKEHTLAGLFSVYFNYKRYFRAMLYGLLWVACAVVMILPIIGSFMQFVIYSESVIIISPVAWIPLIAFWLFTFAAVVCILLYLISCVFFVPYLYLNGMKLKNAFYVSVAISREHRWNIIKQLMGYFLRVLLGILSIGVLLVINAAPKISVSYFVYSNSVFFPVKTED